mgnify:CR=1 FL=1
MADVNQHQLLDSGVLCHVGGAGRAALARGPLVEIDMIARRG